VADFAGKVNNFKSVYTTKQGEHDAIIKEGRVLIDQLNARENWLEVYKAINECLPRDKDGEIVEDIELREGVKLQSIIAEKKKDLSTEWYVDLTETQVLSMLDEDKKPPVGEGYLFTLEGMHYHHEKDDPDEGQGALYVVHSLLENFKQWKTDSTPPHPVRAIGITHPVLIKATTNPTRVWYSPDIREQQMLLQEMNIRETNNMGNVGNVPANNKAETTPMPDGTKPEDSKKIKQIRQTRFIVQFVWQPVPKEEREVNDIIMKKVMPDPAKVPNLEVPLAEIEAEVAKANEAIAAENEKNDESVEKDKEPLKITQEQYDKFKTRFLTKGTPETLPSALKASASATGPLE
jgi:type IV pilus assembly protein PilM